MPMRLTSSIVRFASTAAALSFLFTSLPSRDASADAPPSQYLVPEAKSPTVLDRKTKLIWERSPDSKLRSYTEAQSYCVSLQVDGASGWRLPTMRELMTLVDTRARNPAIDRKAFPSTPYADPYWTSTAFGDTTICKNKSCIWLVDFGTGSADPLNPAVKQGRVRCVRK
jgi:hypothetical protein